MKLRIKEKPQWKYRRYLVQERKWFRWVEIESFETFDEALKFAQDYKNAITYEVV